MKRAKEFVKRNIKLFIGIVVGGIIFGGGVYAASVAANTVSYSNTSSGIAATSVQGAIDTLYKKAADGANRFVSAYTYNQDVSSGTSGYCITGDEGTCVKTDCYTKATLKCPAGTIITYKVNGSKTVRFHVMKDNGTTMTMQSQKTIAYGTKWSSGSSNNSTGPISAMEALDNATKSWDNVNIQTFAYGETDFSGLGYFNGCGETACTKNVYQMEKMQKRARMITMQEAMNSEIGRCSGAERSCRIWMYNYLGASVEGGGTADDSTSTNGYKESGYLSMNATSNVGFEGSCKAIWKTGKIANYSIDGMGVGVRAVVEVNK